MWTRLYALSFLISITYLCWKKVLMHLSILKQMVYFILPHNENASQINDLLSTGYDWIGMIFHKLSRKNVGVWGYRTGYLSRCRYFLMAKIIIYIFYGAWFNSIVQTIVTHNLKKNISIYSNEHVLFSNYQILVEATFEYHIYFQIIHTNIQIYIMNITYMYNPKQCDIKNALLWTI